MRPRGVRCRNPFCTRKGSYTSSIVSASSPTAAAMVPTPTGPPSNFSMIARRIRASISSRPNSSTSSIASASRATSRVMWPCAFTCAKSRTRRSSRLATRGVPRARRASSCAPGPSIPALITAAVRCTISSISGVG